MRCWPVKGPRPGVPNENALHPRGYRALYRGAAVADDETRAILATHHAEQRRRILNWMTQWATGP
ncbi:hypothetical protein [Alloactinosynnema sp. L-07]|nr:hypothetical protein [Alloactinosynnema sp. L-07]